MPGTWPGAGDKNKTGSFCGRRGRGPCEQIAIIKADNMIKEKHTDCYRASKEGTAHFSGWTWSQGIFRKEEALKQGIMRLTEVHVGGKGFRTFSD